MFLFIPIIRRGNSGSVTLAKLRNLMTLCSLRIGNDDYAKTIIDPFTGIPLNITDEMIFSSGPDRQPQGGEIEYDPTNGSSSSGDIILHRPAHD